MDDAPICPACGERRWKGIGERTYRYADKSSVSSYDQIRYDILFLQWVEAEELTLRSVLCEQCGLVVYTPRPTADQLTAKYDYLNKHPEAQSEGTSPQEMDTSRAEALYRRTSSKLPAKAEVLDFGGGNGRLLRPFVDAGYACYVVDFVPECIPGVQRLAEQIHEVPSSSQFDLIICSHVLEHVGSIRDNLCALKNHLKTNGVIYVEVPLEIWKKPPLMTEPVTHINFFTLKSLRNALRVAGLEPVRSSEGIYASGHGPARMVWAVARHAGEGDSRIESESAVAEVEEFLLPSLQTRLIRVLRHPQLYPVIFRNYLKRRD